MAQENRAVRSIRIVGTRQNGGGWRNARQPGACGFSFLIQTHPSQFVDQMFQFIDLHLSGGEFLSRFSLGQLHRALPVCRDQRSQVIKFMPRVMMRQAHAFIVSRHSSGADEF
jgi:hypothetical protein